MQENAEKKDYFGIIEAHRFNGGNPIYYGSKIPHDRGIELIISRSSYTRDVHKDWYSPDEQIISVRMTEGQFAEMITGLNSRKTPCTLVKVCGEHMSEPAELPKAREKIDEELDVHLKKFEERINAMYEKVQGIDFKRKDDKKEVLREIQDFHTKLVNDTPFLKKSFDRDMDAIVMEAKNEVQYFIEDNLGKIDSLPKNEVALLDTVNRSTTPT